jgi:hypothetical protein
MKSHVETPLKVALKGKIQKLRNAAARLGGQDMTQQIGSADVALYFQVLPRVPVLMMFWGPEPEDDLEAEAKLLFDETITDHLDIESIIFVRGRLQQLLCVTTP